MPKQRLRFEKFGKARYISHLDLMRTFQRAFLRAGVPVRHTEGFNPHAYISIALPLSLGFESGCELLDFECAGETSLLKLPALLNAVLPEGIVVQEAYAGFRKFSEITYQRFHCRLFYDRGIPAGIATDFLELCKSESLLVMKKGKKGMVPFDLIPCIHSIKAEAEGASLLLDATVTAQNPALNPQLLLRAMELHFPQKMPDFSSFTRLEIFDKEVRIFR